MNRKTFSFLMLAAALTAVMSGCTPSQPDSRPVVYKDVASAGLVSGVGVESQDIVSVSDTMVRDLLATPALVQGGKPPRIIMDGEYFRNKSSQPIDKGLLINRLRISLQRASLGRLLFVSRESAGMVGDERELVREGVLDTGTTGLTKAQAKGDYRLRGEINSLDARSTSTGSVERYTQISFELIDLESSATVWANIFELKKGGMDDAVYR